MPVHKTSDVQTQSIGVNTNIWQFCVILAGASIGESCNICSHCFIENNVIIGDRVTIKNGVYLFDSIFIEDDVFIGPNVTFTNDRYPRSLRGNVSRKLQYPKTIIRMGASIGGGATILPGVEIGRNSLIGAGSVITKDVPENSVVYGNAAKSIKSRD